MKRLSLLLVLTLMLCSLFGCGKEPAFIQPLTFYYLTADLSYDASCSSVLSETREGNQLHSTQEILNLYFAGPASDTLLSPFPAGVSLISCQLDENVLYLTVSDELAELSGMELTIACGCLALTCLAITEAETVCIQAQTALLGNQKTVTMDAASLLLMDSTG